MSGIPPRSPSGSPPIGAPPCAVCKRPLVPMKTHEVRLGPLRWYICSDCHPVVVAGGTAAADVLHGHVIPEAKNRAMGFLEGLVADRPALKTALAGAFRGYEQGKKDVDPEGH